MSNKTYLAIFNVDQHIVEFEEEYAAEAIVDDGTSAADHNAWRLGVECQGRGSLEGAWQVYRGTVPFSWDIVDPKEA